MGCMNPKQTQKGGTYIRDTSGWPVGYSNYRVLSVAGTGDYQNITVPLDVPLCMAAQITVYPATINYYAQYKLAYLSNIGSEESDESNEYPVNIFTLSSPKKAGEVLFRAKAAATDIISVIMVF